MHETWRPIPLAGYEHHEVSNLGRVRRTTAGSGPAKAGMIRKATPNHKGYLVMPLYHRNGKTRHTFTVHRLVALAFLGPCPAGKQVNHKNGRKADNRATNLEYVTPAENSRHARDVLGYRPPRIYGEQHGRATLTEAHVRRIRALGHSGQFTHREIARMFNVNPSTISRILAHKRWAHLQEV